MIIFLYLITDKIVNCLNTTELLFPSYCFEKCWMQESQKLLTEITTDEKESIEYFCSATYLKHMLKMKTALICTKIESEMSQQEYLVKTKCQIYNDQTFHLSTTEP